MPRQKKLRNSEAESAPDFGEKTRYSEIGGRIRDAIRRAGGPSAVAAKSGLALGTINNSQSGVTLPGAETLLKLAEGTGSSIDWLLTGREVLASALPAGPVEGFVMVPVLPEAASAGDGGAAAANDLEVEKQVAFRDEWMRRIGVNPKRAHVLRVKGDSMEPTLSEGDIVLVDTGDKEPAGGGLYVINWSGDAIVKRLDRDYDGALLVISDAGQRYPPRRIDAAAADHVRIIGRVRWYARTIR